MACARLPGRAPSGPGDDPRHLRQSPRFGLGNVNRRHPAPPRGVGRLSGAVTLPLVPPIPGVKQDWRKIPRRCLDCFSGLPSSGSGPEAVAGGSLPRRVRDRHSQGVASSPDMLVTALAPASGVLRELAHLGMEPSPLGCRRRGEIGEEDPTGFSVNRRRAGALPSHGLCLCLYLCLYEYSRLILSVAVFPFSPLLAFPSFRRLPSVLRPAPECRSPQFRCAAHCPSWSFSRFHIAVIFLRAGAPVFAAGQARFMAQMKRHLSPSCLPFFFARCVRFRFRRGPGA